MEKKVRLIDSSIAEKVTHDLKEIGSKGATATRLQAILSCYKHGAKKVSEVLDLDRSTVNRWVSRYKKDGLKGLASEKKPGRSKIQGEALEKLKEWVENDPDRTLKDLVQKFSAEMGLTLGKSSVSRALEKIHLSSAQRHHVHPSKTKTPLHTSSTKKDPSSHPKEKSEHSPSSTEKELAQG